MVSFGDDSGVVTMTVFIVLAMIIACIDNCVSFRGDDK